MRKVEQLDFEKIKNISALLKAYLSADKKIQHLFANPPSLEHVDAAILAIKKQSINRLGLVTEIKRQYQNLPENELVNSHINLLLNENTFTMTAAHQPALFTGPLYTIYKIANTIHLCKKAKEKYPAYDFVPIFWMGSEDHDFDELGHTFFQEEKIAFQQQFAGPIGRMPADELITIIKQISEKSPQKELLAALEQLATQQQDFGFITQYTLHSLFKEFGLIVLNQDNHFFKNEFKNIIKDEVINQRANKVLAETTAFLNANFKAPISLRDINFFKIDSTSRNRIVQENNTWKINQTAIVFSEEAIQKDIEENAASYSPNVVFRPLMQEFILPNVCFVGGGGEVSYWLQLKPLFDFYNIAYPIVFLRNSFFITNNNIEKKLQKLNLQHIDLFEEKEQVFKQIILKNSAALDFTEEKAAVQQQYFLLAQKAKMIDATLENNVSAELQKTLSNLDAIQHKFLKAEKRRNEDTLTALNKAYTVLFPMGGWQERSQNFLQFSAEEISDLIHYIIFETDKDNAQIYYLSFQ